VRAGQFFASVVKGARGLNAMSDEHFTVDGALIEARASLKSFKLKTKGLARIIHEFQTRGAGKPLGERV
jgi:hypothetical protein